jgi:hypothetical protein
VSQRKIDPNRPNSKHSTGPKTEAGKAKSAENSRCATELSKLSLFRRSAMARLSEINPQGDIVGQHNDASGAIHGFLFTAK